MRFPPTSGIRSGGGGAMPKKTMEPDMFSLQRLTRRRFHRSGPDSRIILLSRREFNVQTRYREPKLSSKPATYGAGKLNNRDLAIRVELGGNPLSHSDCLHRLRTNSGIRNSLALPLTLRFLDYNSWRLLDSCVYRGGRVRCSMTRHGKSSMEAIISEH